MRLPDLTAIALSRATRFLAAFCGAAVALSPGVFRWDGKADGGGSVGAGVYLLRVGAKGITREGRIAVVR